MKFWELLLVGGVGVAAGAAFMHWRMRANTTTVVAAHPTTGEPIALPVSTDVATASSLPCVDNCGPASAQMPATIPAVVPPAVQSVLRTGTQTVASLNPTAATLAALRGRGYR